jgi:hypothetical protein
VDAAATTRTNSCIGRDEIERGGAQSPEEVAMQGQDASADFEELATREQQAWAELQTSFADVNQALREHRPITEVVQRFVAVETARTRWWELSNAKQQRASEAVMRLHLTMTTLHAERKS